MLTDYADTATLSGGLGAWRDFYRRVAALSTLPAAQQNAVLSELASKAPDVYRAVLAASRNLQTAAKRAQLSGGLGSMGELDGFFSSIGKFVSKVASGVGKAVKSVGKYVAPIVGAINPIAGALVGTAVAAAGGDPNTPGASVPAVTPPYSEAVAVLPEIANLEAGASSGGAFGGNATKWLLIGGTLLLALSIVNKKG